MSRPATAGSRPAARRNKALAASMVMLVLGASACAGGVGGASTANSPKAAPSTIPELKPGQQVDITFESYNLIKIGVWTDAVGTLVAQFEKLHPNIHVKAQPPTGSGFANGDFLSSIRSEALAGNPPDVGQVTFNGLDFAASGMGAKPIGELVGQQALQASYGGAHPFAPKAEALGVIGGHTYAVPYVFSTPVLWINATLFKAAGLDPAQPPATWEQAKADALAIAQKTGKGGIYLDCTTKGSGDWCFQSLVDSAGGSVMSADRKQLSFAGAGAIKAVSMAQDLVKSGASPTLSQSQAWEDFSRGNLGMMLETSALQGTFLASAQAGNWTLAAAHEPASAAAPWCRPTPAPACRSSPPTRPSGAPPGNWSSTSPATRPTR